MTYRKRKDDRAKKKDQLHEETEPSDKVFCWSFVEITITTPSKKSTQVGRCVLETELFSHFQTIQQPAKLHKIFKKRERKSALTIFSPKNYQKKLKLIPWSAKFYTGLTRFKQILKKNQSRPFQAFMLVEKPTNMKFSTFLKISCKNSTYKLPKFTT